MKTCKKCGNRIPNYIWIDGIRRSLSKRRYCLDCSPFGKWNNRTLENTTNEDDKSTCVSCGKIYIYSRKRRDTRELCSSCKSNNSRFVRKIKAVEYKGGKCSKCGYDKCLGALQFHHVNPSEKEFSIGGAHCVSWERVLKELDKCILVCANCHVEMEEVKYKDWKRCREELNKTISYREYLRDSPNTPDNPQEKAA